MICILQSIKHIYIQHHSSPPDVLLVLLSFVLSTLRHVPFVLSMKMNDPMCSLLVSFYLSFVVVICVVLHVCACTGCVFD